MYYMDTSSLITAWREQYPPDVFPSLWVNLDRLIRETRLVSPIDVFYELEKGGDALFRWVKERRGMFIEPDNEIQNIVRHLVNKFPQIIPQFSHTGVWADPWVVALAKVNGAIVVTEEKQASSNATRIKIPNMCIDLGVEHINFLELIRRESWNF
ncbi:conserved hypothetical protein [Kyrpidia tusciae DSM 2912]|uniref:DUF4411 family protein n=2 Tax=Kyrpidia TaxID=1129704 RepID=D5WRW0_KYRT2|nr:conserved hypothetical protein [Kyrpidia tusciae DSM 2912]